MGLLNTLLGRTKPVQSNLDSLIAGVQSEITEGVTVLVKGSRVNRLERVVRALTGGG